MTRTVLVTGGNRGIGLEVCRRLATLGLRVILTARDPEPGRQAATELAVAGADVRFEQMDISDDDSVVACASRLARGGVPVDVLVNNAGVYPQGELLSGGFALMREAMEVNLYGALRTCRAFVPGMLKAGYGRVVNVSSGYGAFSDGLVGPAFYSLSKAALNAATLILSHEVSGDVKVNAACPGWVRTRMGGHAATRSVEDGADTIVWLATLPSGGPHGKFFRDRRVIAW